MSQGTQEYSNWISNCPAQDEGFGEANFYNGDGFSCRYLERNIYIYRSIYIPYGPNIENINGFHNFLAWIDGFRFTKVTIDLYKILFDTAERKIIAVLNQHGFRKREYAQEPKTILIYQDSYAPNSRALKYVRSVERKYNIEIINGNDVDDITLSRCFDIYKESCQKKGYKLRRSQQYMRSLLSRQNGYLAVVIDKEYGHIEGFILSSIRSIKYKTQDKKIMYLVFTAMSEKGKADHVGYSFTHRIIELAFLKLNVDTVDFFGFGGAHSIFKTKFGGEAIDLSGSYEKLRLL